MDISEILNNKCLIVPILLWLIIQIFKFVCDSVKNKKLNFKRLLGAGGMPSSHSAVVCSLAVLVGKSEGFDSPTFAISIILAAVVLYDACGVRRAAGKQASLLNKIISENNTITPQEKLNEVLGHTPTQVLVGSIIGIVAGILV